MQNQNMITSGYDNFNYGGWKSYNKINKKAMEQEFSAAGLFISLSIAFFIVLASSMILNSIFLSLKNENQNENFIKQKFYKFEAGKTVLEFSDLLKIKQASAFSEYSGKIDNWTDYLNMEAGQIAEYEARFVNTGATDWKKGEVSLETGPFLNTVSLINHPSWERVFRVSYLDRDVRPGESYAFKFKILGPEKINGVIQENFQLVVGGFPIQGTILRLFVDVKVREPAIIENQFKNSSEENDEINNQEKVINSFKNENEKLEEISTDGQKENFINSQADLSSSQIVESSQLISEPVLRVGLFDSFKTQRLYANDFYDVYSGKNLIISGLRPGYVSTVSFDSNKNQYIVTTPGISKFSYEPLRFIPRNETGIITLMDFENRARWDSNINYNQYRRVIEFNYSAKTGKLWIINELPISQYLKGITETTNYSPVEYQKVIATAARTYAMYHYNRGLEFNIPNGSTKHQNNNFHLDSVYDQVYKGYVSETLLSRLSQAVEETRGMVVTYQNKVVVTPYFSRSDGRTRSWEEVWHGGPMPWLKSVPAPQDAGQALWGHGVGLSAQAALIMARDENKSWQSILKYFYQNTELQKIY
jgi:hypothetical protein